MNKQQKICEKLQQFFMDAKVDLPSIKFKKIKPNGIIFKTGESIDSLYYIINGDVCLKIHDKTFELSSGIYLGDYQAQNQHTYRTTELRASNNHVSIAILPFDFYFNLNLQFVDKQLKLQKMLKVQDKKLKYVLKKLMKEKIALRGEVIKLDGKDLGLVFQGNFKLKKHIDICYLRKEDLHVSKQFQITMISPSEYVRETIICDSPSGIIYIVKQEHMKRIFQYFDEFQKKILWLENKSEIHHEREKKIKDIVQNKNYLSSIIPSMLIKQSHFKSFNEETFKNFPRGISQKLPLYYKIKRQNQNTLQTEPTDNNFSLIPFKKSRKSKMPEERKKHWSPLKVLKIKTQQSQKMEVQKQHLPAIFQNKFDQKMFFRVSNPFHRSVTGQIQSNTRIFPEKFPSRKKKYFLSKSFD